MLNCQQISELISLQQEQSLCKSQYIQLKIHLMLCPYCRAFKRNTDKLNLFLKGFCQGYEGDGLKVEKLTRE
ncbi:zf-HC2 domain-containing protein [Glaesserella parasuis]|uniref:anti-sigma factor family protein n=1 Tax=Glaesserella parasuis TaxID=738 RepID=UPI0024367AC0|nr:zf-HC2 domain-containing protein [Glaesserella parasuis]MDG6260426.1 zf-HC2 domain-containing protein [Glaesserella parasuis]MDO9737017.1 zf-HC2 domain-containing protein [Glaesserella parasuis]MDO9789738.1 zf-HC2 domain-containing protein [Glaesserella parasuis]MDO9876087.1 zf-HC2 domain-containing protein [Glaesserella parasuis]MDO9878170.1 zf-HC2 domain-containing protein [Glaesserella parasuis]